MAGNIRERLRPHFDLRANLARMLVPPSTQLRSLDGIRALSILWMVSYHVLWLSQYYLDETDLASLRRSSALVPLWNGHLGVDASS